MRSFRLAPLLVLLVSQSVLAAAYDEILDPQGHVRPAYNGVYQIVERMTPVQKQDFLDRSKIAFQKDNTLDYQPRVLDQATYDQMVKGVDQRARTIRAFLQDHYSGKKRYKAVLSPELVDRIIERTGETGYQGLIHPEDIAFPYGPDMIIDQAGQFRFIEDNIGFIGGPGDLRLARSFMLENQPGLKHILDTQDPEVYYKQLTDSYKERAKAYGGKAFYFAAPFDSDKEDRRTEQIMRDHGVEVIDLFDKTSRIKIKADGAYIVRDVNGVKTEDKVGFMALCGEHGWIDPSHPASFERLVVEEAHTAMSAPETTPMAKRQLRSLLDLPRTKGNLEKISSVIGSNGKENFIEMAKYYGFKYRGIVQAILDRKVGTNYSPGLDFVGDKEFYTYIEKLTRFYLKEEPIIRNIRTGRFVNDDGSFNQKHFDMVFSHLDEIVVKQYDGRGGQGIYIGPKLDAAKIKEAREAVLANPSKYCDQDFLELSTIGNRLIVDIRVISDIDAKSARFANMPWGRGLPKEGDGMVNISKEGREIAVLVDKGQPRRACRALFY